MCFIWIDHIVKVDVIQMHLWVSHDFFSRMIDYWSVILRQWIASSFVVNHQKRREKEREEKRIWTNNHTKSIGFFSNLSSNVKQSLSDDILESRRFEIDWFINSEEHIRCATEKRGQKPIRTRFYHKLNEISKPHQSTVERASS